MNEEAFPMQLFCQDSVIKEWKTDGSSIGDMQKSNIDWYDVKLKNSFLKVSVA